MKMVWVISFILSNYWFFSICFPTNFSDTTLSPNGTEQATDHYQTALYEEALVQVKMLLESVFNLIGFG